MVLWFKHAEIAWVQFSMPATEAGEACERRKYLQLREAIVDDVMMLEMEEFVESSVMDI